MRSKGYHLGLIGYPLGHSFSPVIHTSALESLGMTGNYKLYPISPLPKGKENLEALLKQMRTGIIDGLNVTIPHKKNVIPLLDSLTPLAAHIGAVNTIYRDDDQLIGDNTDAPGFLVDLKTIVNQIPETCLVLGAGGAARAVVFSLLPSSQKIYIAARRLNQANQLTDDILISTAECPTKIQPIELNPASIRKAAAEVELIINTTPVGMAPQINASPWPETVPFPPQSAVYDLVYNPPETQLMKTACIADLPAQNGIGMLIEQARIAFERWTGILPPHSAIQKALALHLETTAHSEYQLLTAHQQEVK